MNRSTISLIVLLIVLGIAAYFLLPSQEERESSYKPAEIDLTIDSASIVKIELFQPGKPVTLENIGGKWMLTSPMKYPGDESAIKQIISGIKKFKVGSLISSNVEKQAVFQVDTAGTKIIMTDRGGKSTSIIIGKTGPSYSEVYFRMPGSKDVYLGEGIEPWTINREVKEWRDKVIFASPSELIKDLTYYDGGKEYRLHRDSTGWQSEEKSVDVNAMNSVLNSLANLRADDFADNEVKSTSHPVKLSIHANEDVDVSLSPTQTDSLKYYVQTSKSPQTYIISKWSAQQLLKPIEKAGPAKRGPAVATAPKKEEEKPPAAPPVAAKQPEKETVPSVSPSPKQETGKTAQHTESPKKTGESKPITSAPGKTGETVKNEPPATVPSTSQKPPPQRRTPKTLFGGTSTTPNTQGAQSASPSSTEDEGDLTVHTVARGETMQVIAKKYNVSVEQILKWNLLKTIVVKPGQELYVFVKKAPKK